MRDRGVKVGYIAEERSKNTTGTRGGGIMVATEVSIASLFYSLLSKLFSIHCFQNCPSLAFFVKKKKKKKDVTPLELFQQKPKTQA